MAISSPTIISNSSGGVSVDVVGMTYEAFLNSLGSNVFRILEIYMTASSIAQLHQQIKYSIGDATGIQFDQILNYAVDPYQKVPAYRIDLSGENVILNGQSDLQFTLLPGESLMLQLVCDQYTPADVLDSLHPDVANRMDNENPSVNVLVSNDQNIPHEILYQGQTYDVKDANQILVSPVQYPAPVEPNCQCPPKLNISGSLRRRIEANIKKKQNKVTK